MKSFDAVVFHVLKVSPEEFALTNCGWTKKEKFKLSPNVVAMTQRFNHTSFWVIREILNAGTLKIRAEVLSHFIKIAKKLVDLNNLHSLMAVVQSLSSSSIFRLTKTWALVNKHQKATFDRLLALVKEDDNRWMLRSHMEAIKLPCIPFLGMYLSDIMYINSAHPDTGGLESTERTNKMNNVLRVMAEFQQSKYDHLQEQPHIKNYLNSVKYIEELQKFLEEDNYKLSLKIEPTISHPHGVVYIFYAASPRLTFRDNRRQEPTCGEPFEPPRVPNTPPRRHSLPFKTDRKDTVWRKVYQGRQGKFRLIPTRKKVEQKSLTVPRFESYLRRKCVSKHGRKPTMSHWTKYWVCLCDTQLVYYAAKTIRGQERSHFKARPCKAISIRGWMVLYSEDPSRLDCFQLSNPDNGNVYRFQSENKDIALVWISNLKEAVKGYPQPERDLINLEDT
uniref:Ras-GEF domain-containing protein n=1 Tax=Ciona savignyi TaxID=51511 RepID=H2Z5D8_CIOSA